MKDEQKRLFFVVDIKDDEGQYSNNEIFETLDEADEFAKGDGKARIRIAIVKHAYRDSDGQGGWGWNYEDLSDTFEFIRQLQ